MHREQLRLLRRLRTNAVAALAEGFAGPHAVEVENKRQAPPRLHDLPGLQRVCGSRFGWSATRTLAVVQELYDGAGRVARERRLEQGREPLSAGIGANMIVLDDRDS